MAKTRYRCHHCGTEGNFRTQLPISTAQGVGYQVPGASPSSCRDTIKCNARLRKAVRADKARADARR